MSDVGKAVNEVIEAFLIMQITARLQVEKVAAVREAGLSWRELAAELNAAGVECTASGLHSKYGRRR
jgi:hypothetical protein